jgi:hypothetical protein
MAKTCLFAISLIFFTFARRTKKITFFFVKNTTKSCNIVLHFHFLELKSIFPIFRFLHSISSPKNEKLNKKSVKNSLFFTIWSAHIGAKHMCIVWPLYEHSKNCKKILTRFFFIFWDAHIRANK